MNRRIIKVAYVVAICILLMLAAFVVARSAQGQSSEAVRPTAEARRTDRW